MRRLPHLVIAALMLSSLCVQPALATTYAFLANQNVANLGDTLTHTTPTSTSDLYWEFYPSNGISSTFMTDGGGWLSRGASYNQLVIFGFGNSWNLDGIDVRNTGATARTINVTTELEAGGSKVDIFTVKAGATSTLTTSGHGPVADGGRVTITWGGSATTVFFNSPQLSPAYSSPTVTTGAASSVTSSTATIAGEVSQDGGKTVTARGICWGTSASPTVAGNHTVDGSGVGTFSGSLTGLAAGTGYYARAYATNTEGTSYGDEVSFTTLSEPSGPSVVSTPASGPVSLLLAGAMGLALVALKRARTIRH